MDDNSHRHRLETSPLTVGLMGVMGGVMLVAICHVIAMLFCRSGRQQTTQTTADDDNTTHVADGQERPEANDELLSVAAANDASTNIQVIVDDKSLTKYYPHCKELDVCAVCLGEFNKDGRGQVVRVLPQCGHVFHVRCIDMWLFNHRSCPLCRANALLPPNHSSSRGGTAEILISSS